MAFTQLSYRDGLRDIEACLAPQQGKLYRIGILAPVARSALADAKEQRDRRIDADLPQPLAYLSGFLNRKGDGFPGPQMLWIGLQPFPVFVLTL
jgi:hypothetical protein